MPLATFTHLSNSLMRYYVSKIFAFFSRFNRINSILLIKNKISFGLVPFLIIIIIIVDHNRSLVVTRWTILFFFKNMLILWKIQSYITELSIFSVDGSFYFCYQLKSVTIFVNNIVDPRFEKQTNFCVSYVFHWIFCICTMACKIG